MTLAFELNTVHKTNASCSAVSCNSNVGIPDQNISIIQFRKIKLGLATAETEEPERSSAAVPHQTSRNLYKL